MTWESRSNAVRPRIPGLLCTYSPITRNAFAITPQGEFGHSRPIVRRTTTPLAVPLKITGAICDQTGWLELIGRLFGAKTGPGVCLLGPQSIQSGMDHLDNVSVRLSA